MTKKTATAKMIPKTIPKTPGNQASSKQPPLLKRAPNPHVRFTPYAWAKLIYLRDVGSTEIGGFGITSLDDPLLVTDIQLIQQTCSMVTVAFDDDAVADYYDEMVDNGYQPAEFGRIWVHTHPGDCPRPSNTDEDTFARVFGATDWSVMFILAQGGKTYQRIKFNVGPGCDMELSSYVDWTAEFSASDVNQWEQEYLTLVSEERAYVPPVRGFSQNLRGPAVTNANPWSYGNQYDRYTDDDAYYNNLTRRPTGFSHIDMMRDEDLRDEINAMADESDPFYVNDQYAGVDVSSIPVDEVPSVYEDEDYDLSPEDLAYMQMPGSQVIK